MMAMRASVTLRKKPSSSAPNMAAKWSRFHTSGVAGGRTVATGLGLLKFSKPASRMSRAGALAELQNATWCPRSASSLAIGKVRVKSPRSSANRVVKSSLILQRRIGFGASGTTFPASKTWVMVDRLASI